MITNARNLVDKCGHCGTLREEMKPICINNLVSNFYVNNEPVLTEVIFCDPVCLFLFVLDDVLYNPTALSHMKNKEAWLPVIKQLHVEIMK